MKLTVQQLRQIIAEEYKDQSPEPNEYTVASKLTDAIWKAIGDLNLPLPTGSDSEEAPGMINSYYAGANNPYAGMAINILNSSAVVMSPNGEVRQVFVNHHYTLEAAAEEVAENVKEFMLQIDDAADERAAEEILGTRAGDLSSYTPPIYESKLTLHRLKQIIVEEILQRKKTMKLTNEEVKVLDRYGNPLKPLFDHVFELKDGTNRATFKGEGHALARRDYRESLRKKGKGVSEDKVITLWGEDSSGTFGVWTHPDDRVPDTSMDPKKWAIEAALRAQARGDKNAWGALSVAANSDLDTSPEDYLNNLKVVAEKAWTNRVKREKPGYRNESKLTLRRLKQIIVEEIVAETKKN